MLKIVGFAKRSTELRKKTIDALLSSGVDIQIFDNKSDTIRLVFAGQYSAGKSSILKMLTGRDDITIGAGITTQHAHTYDWNGIEVVDTPGIHTQLRPDHDKISYDAIASADMLVFVITNELFDSYMADHFRKLAIEKDKAGEMILVVNKMDRTAGGNTGEQQNIIREDLKKILEPYTPEQLNLSFLDAESYLESIEEKDKDPELANELIERSGYAQFVDTLNRFVEEKSIPSKLTTELYVIDDCLEKAIKELQPKSSDADIEALEENFMQQRHLLIEARGRMQQEVLDIYTTAASQIRDIGLDAANLLVEGCKQDEVENELQKAINKTEDIIDKCQSDADEVIDARLSAVYNTEQVHAVHGRTETGVAEVGKAVLPHPGCFVYLHPLRCLPGGLLFRAEGFDNHQTANTLLEKDSQLPVAFLHTFMQPFQHLTENVGQQHQQQSSGQQHHCKVAVQEDQRNERGYQPYRHTRQPGQNLHIPVGDHHGIVGQAVQPFLGMNRADGSVILPEDIVYQPLFESILKGGL